MKIAVFFSLLSSFLVFACKPVSKPGNTEEIASRKQDADATKPTKTWGKVEIDERGLLRQPLILSLDYFDHAKDYSGALPKCLKPFPPDEELGTAVCIKGGKKESKILASQVTQDCYTQVDFERIEAKTVLEMSGCQEIQVLGYAYEPPVRLEVEK